MQRSDVVSRVARKGWLLLCPFLAGCVLIGYAYPAVSHTPAVPLGPYEGEVRAFRVDLADEQNPIEFGENDRYLLCEIPLSRSGNIPAQAQAQVALDYGLIWHCVAVSFHKHTSQTVMVRLYRPGWQTVEVKSWQRAGRADWREAPDAAAQEQAVDDLLSTWENDSFGKVARRGRAGPCGPENSDAPPREVAAFRHLVPGSASAGHRRVLLFAASEYERLAAVTDQEAARRLADKAEWLQELATK